MSSSEDLELVVQVCRDAGWVAEPIKGEKAVRAMRDGRSIELRVSRLGPNSRGQWLKSSLRVGPDMFACPIIDGTPYLIPSEEWLDGDMKVLGSAEYPQKPSKPEWTMTRDKRLLPPFLAAHGAKDILERHTQVGRSSEPSSSRTDSSATAEVVDIESSNVEESRWQTTSSSKQALRRESQLVARYAEHLGADGVDVKRLRIETADGETLFCDLWIPSLRLLIEAKSNCDRASIRMAIGQLVDYSRAVEDCSQAVLLPARPSRDLIALIHRGGAFAIWPSEERFVNSEEAPAPTK